MKNYPILARIKAVQVLILICLLAFVPLVQTPSAFADPRTTGGRIAERILTKKTDDIFNTSTVRKLDDLPPAKIPVTNTPRVEIIENARKTVENGSGPLFKPRSSNTSQTTQDNAALIAEQRKAKIDADNLAAQKRAEDQARIADQQRINAANAEKTRLEEVRRVQEANIKRFEKKIPSNSKDSVKMHDLPNRGVAVQATSPGKVPGSRAVYEKQIDVNGKTVQSTKTTYDPQGKIIHVKDKLNNTIYP